MDMLRTTSQLTVRFGMFCLLETIELTISVEFRNIGRVGWAQNRCFFQVFNSFADVAVHDFLTVAVFIAGKFFQS